MSSDDLKGAWDDANFGNDDDNHNDRGGGNDDNSSSLVSLSLFKGWLEADKQVHDEKPVELPVIQTFEEKKQVTQRASPIAGVKDDTSSQTQVSMLQAWQQSEIKVHDEKPVDLPVVKRAEETKEVIVYTGMEPWVNQEVYNVQQEEPKQVVNEVYVHQQIQPANQVYNHHEPNQRVNEVFRSERTRQRHTKACAHDEACALKVIRGAAKGFMIGYGVKTTIALLQVLIRSGAKVFKSRSALALALFNTESVSFGAFLGMYNLVLQSVTCALRAAYGRKREGARAFAAGALAGYCGLKVYRVNSSAKALWALFLLSRAFECVYTSLKNRRIIPSFKQDWSFIFSAMWSLIAYNTSFEPCNLPMAQVRFGNTFAAEDVSDCGARYAWVIKKNRELIEKFGDDFTQCNPTTYLPRPREQIKLGGKGVK